MRHYLQIIVFCLSILLLTSCHSKQDDKDFFFKGDCSPIEEINITENGKTYEIPAVSGHCIVFFQDNVSWANAKLIIERNGGRIIEQLPDFDYYLVSVKPGKENDFIERMKAEKDVAYVFLNMTCSIKSEIIIVDNFSKIDPDMLTTHGNGVRTTFFKYSSLTSHLIPADVGEFLFRDLVCSIYSRRCYELLHGIKQTKTKPVLINVSLGVPKAIGDRRLYDEDYTEKEKDNYKKQYLEQLKAYAVCFNKMRKIGYSDFLVSLASGNEGMRDLGAIIGALGDEERQSLEKNLIIVNAVDGKKNKDYSNSVKKKHPLATTIDITSEPWSGTSFAAPKLLGFVDMVSYKYKTLTAQDMLQAIRNATPSDTKQPMTYEMLEKEAAKLAETKKQCKQYTFTLNMTSDYKGEWDLSDGNGQEIVQYHVHDTYSYEYLAGNKMAIDIDNTTNYDLEILLEVLDPDKEVRSLRYMLEKGQKESFYAQRLDLFGDSDHISVRETQVTITTW